MMAPTIEPAADGADTPLRGAALYERYNGLITDTERWYLPDVQRVTGYTPPAVSLWRRRAVSEGGHGPVGLTKPDDYEAGRGTAEGRRPVWIAGPAARVLIQRGVLSPDGRPQRPRTPGRRHAGKES